MKEFQNITNKQIAQYGVQSLSDRPNSASAYGEGGMSPLELKLAFDKLATFLAGKINEIHKAFASDEAGQYLRVLLGEYEIDNLADFIAAVKSGRLAEILQIYPSAGAEELQGLQNVINTIAKSVGEIDEISATLEEFQNAMATDVTIENDGGEPSVTVKVEKVDKSTKWVFLFKNVVGVSGKDGEDGADGMPPHIGENGNWFIGDTDTGVPALQYSYGAEDITAGSTPIATGTLYFVYE